MTVGGILFWFRRKLLTEKCERRSPRLLPVELMYEVIDNNDCIQTFKNAQNFDIKEHQMHCGEV